MKKEKMMKDKIEWIIALIVLIIFAGIMVYGITNLVILCLRHYNL